MRKFLIIPLFLMAVLFVAACGDGSTEAVSTETQAHGAPAHEISPEMEQKILADATDDLKIIAAAGKDTTTLPQALTGQALDDTKATVAQDLAEGRYRQRDYQNINIRVSELVPGSAGVFAEFDDNGYYVDASTGAALTEPDMQHKTYALALVEEEGRWKIKGIFASAASTTATTATTPQ